MPSQSIIITVGYGSRGSSRDDWRSSRQSGGMPRLLACFQRQGVTSRLRVGVGREPHDETFHSWNQLVHMLHNDRLAVPRVRTERNVR